MSSISLSLRGGRTINRLFLWPFWAFEKAVDNHGKSWRKSHKKPHTTCFCRGFRAGFVRANYMMRSICTSTVSFIATAF